MEFLLRLVWILLSILKFQVTMVTSTIFSNSVPMTIESLIGGLLGIIIFTYIGVSLEKWIIKKYPNKFKKFSWRNRKLAILRKKGGIFWISILTPILIGIPIGVLLCSTLTTDKMSIIKPMVISVFIWTSIYYLIGYII